MGSGPGRKAKPALPSLYHNGTALYQNDAATRDILYPLNERRTNRGRIGDKTQIFVCSPQHVGEGQFLTLPIEKMPDSGGAAKLSN
jgi:hypothetical protein